MRGISILAAGTLALAIMPEAAPLAAQPGAAVPRLRPAPGLRLGDDFMIGTWSDREDCRAAIEIQRGGQFLNPDGTRGTWRLEGDVLTFTGTRAIIIRVVPRSRDEVVVVQANGTLGYSRRCPGAPRR